MDRGSGIAFGQPNRFGETSPDKAGSLKQIVLVIRRGGAFFIDVLILSALSYPVLLSLGSVADYAEAPYSHVTTAMLWIWVAYFVLFDWLYGASLGKFVMRLRVERITGGRISFWQSLIRALGWFVIPLVVAGLVELFEELPRSPTQLRIGVCETIQWGITVFGPLSVIVFGSATSISDQLVNTRVVSQGSSYLIQPTRRKLFLCVVFSLLIGLAFSWGEVFLLGLVGFQADVGGPRRPFRVPVSEEEQSYLTDGLSDTSAVDSIEEISKQDIPESVRGRMRSFDIPLSTASTSLSELVILKNIAASLQRMPGDRWPKCAVVNFSKTADFVLIGLGIVHQVVVCTQKNNGILKTTYAGQSSEDDRIDLRVEANPGGTGLALIGIGDYMFRRKQH